MGEHFQAKTASAHLDPCWFTTIAGSPRATPNLLSRPGLLLRWQWPTRGRKRSAAESHPRRAREKTARLTLRVRRGRGGLDGLRALLEIDSDEEDSGWPGDIQKGGHVRVVKSTHGFAGIQVGEVGVVRSRDSDGDDRVNFPKKNGWCALAAPCTPQHSRNRF